jgi:hypothetical protein
MREEVRKGWWDPNIFGQFEKVAEIGARLSAKSKAAGK